MEIWKDIKGYEGHYQISNYGRVLSLSKWRKNGYTGYLSKEKYLKPYTNFRGVKNVILVKDGIKKGKTVHSLVLRSFISNPENKPCCNHKDCNPSNNHIDNLEWCTYKENIQHAMKNNLMDWSFVCYGEKHGKSKLKEKDVIEIKIRLKNREHAKDICKIYNVHNATIWQIDKGNNWKHIKV